jgi:hypothetical protein
LNRRRFLKYAVATGAVAGASALGLDYLLPMRPAPQTQANMTTTASKLNLPPIADFSVTPKYLNPTDQQAIQFTNLSYDPDGDPLKFTWLVDNQTMSHDKDFSTELAQGTHTVELVADDGHYQTPPSYYQSLTIEPDQIYLTKSLQMEFKGIDYAAGRVSPEFVSTPASIPDHDKMDEQLGTIRNELGCNGVSIWAGAGYEDNLIDACQIALQKGFDRIYVLPKYMHFTVDEIAEKLESLAPRITALRETSDKIVWAIGNEYTYCVKGIIPGDTFNDQLAWISQHHDDYIEAQQTNIPQVFEQILPIIAKSYDYPVAYNAEPNEIDLVPWSNPIFESVGWNAYLHPQWGEDETFFIHKFSQLSGFGKPLIVSEFGSSTYSGALTSDFQGQPYDEDEQAGNLDRYCKMLNLANAAGTLVNGAFLYIYNEEWDEGWGLYNGMKRKKGFYMYKSYQRSK